MREFSSVFHDFSEELCSVSGRKKLFELSIDCDEIGIRSPATVG
jgi:hypothetical protein